MKAGVIAELRAIAARNAGVLCPEDVVLAAANAASPLHPLFEWDDSSAAHKYRLEQARHVIRVCVEVIPSARGPVSVFVSLSGDRNRAGGYRALASVLADDGLRAALLRDARKDMQTFCKRYARLAELAGVFAAMSVALVPEAVAAG